MLCVTAALLVSTLGEIRVEQVGPGRVPTSNPLPWSLGTKTPYWGKATAEVHPHQRGESCTPIHVQFVVRHGSRYTDSEDFDELATLMTQYGSAITARHFQYLKNYKNPFPRDQQKHLAARGRQELFQQGQRFRSKYSRNLLRSATYNPDVFKVEHTYKSRTGSSASAFMLGAFPGSSSNGLGSCRVDPFHAQVRWNGRDGWNADYTESDGDTVLRPADNCARFELELADNKQHKANAYPDQYESQNITAELVPRVAAKLGWNNNVMELKAKHVELFYKACMYEAATMTKTSGNACDLFTQRDFEMYAFHKDLGEYYEAGKGSAPYSDVLACPLFTKMVNDLAGAIDGTSKVKAGLHFTHSDTVMALMALLGMYADDTPPTPGMSWEEAQKRKWRSDTISPMGSNIQFIIHKCSPVVAAHEGTTLAEEKVELRPKTDTSDRPRKVSTTTTYRIEIRHNEFHAKWPRCGKKTNTDFCNIEELKEAYPGWKTCDFDSSCAKAVSATPTPPTAPPTPVPPVSDSAPSTAASLVYALVAMCFAML